MARGMLRLGFGISSDRWTTTSGVPSEYAPAFISSTVRNLIVGDRHTVQHAYQKHEAVAGPAGLVLPVGPDVVVAGISGASLAGHDRADEHGDHTAKDEQAETNLVKERQPPIPEEHDAGTEPGLDDVDDEHVPALIVVVGMEECPHRHDDVALNGTHGRRAEDVAEAVPPVSA